MQFTTMISTGQCRSYLLLQFPSTRMHCASATLWWSCNARNRVVGQFTWICFLRFASVCAFVCVRSREVRSCGFSREGVAAINHVLMILSLCNEYSPAWTRAMMRIQYWSNNSERVSTERTRWVATLLELPTIVAQTSVKRLLV